MSSEYPCIYFEKDGKCRKFSDDTVISYCVMGPCSEQKLSNADRIRSMSDEELVSFMMYPVCKYTGCKGDCTEKNIGVTGCRKKILNWLQQPAKEE